MTDIAALTEQNAALTEQVAVLNRENAELKKLLASKTGSEVEPESNEAIFLRELISNATDALDQVRDSRSVVDSELDLCIKVTANKSSMSLVIEDSGIGMTRATLMKGLGTIGSESKTRGFINSMTTSKTGLIDNLGIGFHSAFLVAEKVTVQSRHNEAVHMWEATAGCEFYSVSQMPSNTLARGTRVILLLKKEMEKFLDEDRLTILMEAYGTGKYPMTLGDKAVKFNPVISRICYVTDKVELALLEPKHAGPGGHGRPRGDSNASSDAFVNRITQQTPVGRRGSIFDPVAVQQPSALTPQQVERRFAELEGEVAVLKFKAQTPPTPIQSPQVHPGSIEPLHYQQPPQEDLRSYVDQRLSRVESNIARDIALILSRIDQVDHRYH